MVKDRCLTSSDARTVRWLSSSSATTAMPVVFEPGSMLMATSWTDDRRQLVLPACCLIEESYPNFSTWGLLSRVNCICRFALTRALHGVAAWDHLWYSVNVGRAWVKAVEFGSGVVGAEPPVDGDARCVALALVGGDLALQCVRVGISPLEAGAAQRAERDLCHPFGKLRTGLSQLACLGVW